MHLQHPMHAVKPSGSSDLKPQGPVCTKCNTRRRACRRPCRNRSRWRTPIDKKYNPCRRHLNALSQVGATNNNNHSSRRVARHWSRWMHLSTRVMLMLGGVH